MSMGVMSLPVAVLVRLSVGTRRSAWISLLFSTWLRLRGRLHRYAPDARVIPPDIVGLLSILIIRRGVRFQLRSEGVLRVQCPD